MQIKRKKMAWRVVAKLNELSGSEALYGFCGWLTSRDEPTTMSGHDDAGCVADLVDTFCKTNDLSDPRDGWDKKLKHPKTASTMKTWPEIRKEYVQKYGDQHHHLLLICSICGATETCRCMAPKITEQGLCDACMKLQKKTSSKDPWRINYDNIKMHGIKPGGEWGNKEFPVCDECVKGTHYSYGKSHVTGTEGRQGCKNIGMFKGERVQCVCSPDWEDLWSAIEKGQKKVATIEDFLACLGLGPKYKPHKPKKYPCPQCGQTNAIYKEEHPDTDMNEMVLSCPDCGFSKTALQIKQSEIKTHITHGYNSYGSKWTSLKEIKRLEVEDRDNKWFDDSSLDLNKTKAIWVTEDPRDAVLYNLSSEFKDVVESLKEALPEKKPAGLNMTEEEYQEERKTFLDAKDNVSEVFLGEAVPVIEHGEIFGKAYLFIKPIYLNESKAQKVASLFLKRNLCVE